MLKHNCRTQRLFCIAERDRSTQRNNGHIGGPIEQTDLSLYIKLFVNLFRAASNISLFANKTAVSPEISIVCFLVINRYIQNCYYINKEII